jgi:hypothetical protein
MPSELFAHHFPEIGKAETRSLNLAAPVGGVPAGAYGFVEAYCTEPGCDCRRALLQVFTPQDGIVAVVSYGFDRSAPMAGPFVDPLNPSAPYAPDLLKLMNELLFSDPEYVARLERHYRMMKAKIDGARSAGDARPSPAARAEDRKKKRKDKKRRRPW